MHGTIKVTTTKHAWQTPRPPGRISRPSRRLDRDHALMHFYAPAQYNAHVDATVSPSASVHAVIRLWITTAFLPRCMECRCGLAMIKLSVCPSVRLSVRPSVRLSVKRVDCDKTEERSVQIDRRTDGQTDGQTEGQTEFSSLDRVCIPCSAVKIARFRVRVRVRLGLGIRLASFFLLLNSRILEKRQWVDVVQRSLSVHCVR